MRRPSEDSIAVGEEKLLAALRSATLGEYEILGELGRGGMAVVFLAHDIALDRKVAIKVMSPALLLMDAEIQTRFKREARTAAGLSHPHIIPVYTVKEDREIVYFVMKYIAGRSLESVIKEVGALPFPMVRTILSQIGGALGYAHRNGVVHRDMKPANIMLDEEGWVVVTDFGIAKVAQAEALTLTGGVVGTPAYMSPEQCAGRQVDGAADQYSLGVMAFEMITGRQPFQGGTMVNVMYDHCHTAPPSIGDLRPDCPPDLAAAVTRMLAKDPADRFASVEESVAAIGVVSNSQSGTVRTEMLTLAREGPAAALLEKFRTPGSPLPGKGAASRHEAVRDVTPAASLHEAETVVVDDPDPPLSRGRRRVVWLAPVLVAAGIGAWLALGNHAPAETTSQTATPPATRSPPATAVIDIDVDPVTLDLTSGESRSITAVPRGADGQPTQHAVSWSSADPTVVTVSDSGIVTAVAQGTTTISVRSGNVTALVATTVTAPSAPVSRAAAPTREAVAAVLLGPGSDTLTVGESQRLTATVRGQAGNQLEDRELSWTSSDPTVTTVSQSGLVRATSAGTARITATVEGHSASTTITVIDRAVARVQLSPASASLEVGQTIQLSARLYASDGVSVTGRTITWSSEAPSVVRVSPSGLATAVAPGTAAVLARVGEAEGSVPVVVEPSAQPTPPPPDPDNARAEIEAKLEAYRQGIESQSIDRLRQVFPQLSADEERSWRSFFANTRELSADFRILSLDITGDTAAVRFEAVYRFRTSRDETQSVTLTATFEHEPGGWSMTRVQ
jgi:serine/threonine-protein kinase